MLLYCIWITSANQEKRFAMYEEKSPGSASAEVVIASSNPISCARACVRRSSCLSFSISDSTCSLYDSYVKDPTSQLHTQMGQAFCNIALKEKVSLTTANTNKINSGKANFFPQLRINKSGHVLKWQVRCGTAGVVVLAIWRGVIASSITLVGKHYITVPEDMQNQLVTYNVPVEETVRVDSDDFVGFHHESNEPDARVKVTEGGQTPDGVAIENVYYKRIYDNDLPIGKTIVEYDGKFK